MKKYIKIVAALLLVASLGIMDTLTVLAETEEKQQTTESENTASSESATQAAGNAATGGKITGTTTTAAEDSSAGTTADGDGALQHQVYCTVLGDSIAKGYSGDKSVWIENYGSLVTKKIAYESGYRYNYRNFAKNGLASKELNENILTKKRVQFSLAKSDLILITIGSNDLLDECKNVVQDLLNTDTKFKSADEALKSLKSSVKKNPLLVLSAIDALSNWDYQSFETQWKKMMKTVNSIKKEDAQIIVTTIYNPVADMKLPATMNQVVEGIIENMNSIIIKNADKYGYEVADVFDSAISAHVQKDGLHPDQQGQQIIADLVDEKWQNE